jgi:hypothetical protein
MHFPPSARLVDGEHSTGLHPYLIAQVEMPIDAVDEYVDMQSSPFSWGRIQRGPDAESWFQMVDGSATVLQMMQRRGWQLEPGRAVLSAQANTAPTGSHLCWVVVQEGPRDAVLVYIYWEQT